MTGASQPMHDDEPTPVCPGRHSPDKPAPALRPDETLCKRCVDRAYNALIDIYGDVDQLDLNIHRQDKGGNLGRSARHKGDEPPLPFNAKASEVSADVHDRLWQWAQMLNPSIVPPTMHRPGTVSRPEGADEDTIAFEAAARYRRSPEGLTRAVETLLDHRNFLRVDPAGPDLADAIAYCRRRLRSHFDRHDERWYAGPCDAMTIEVGLVDGMMTPREKVCGRSLYARIGETDVVCDGYRRPRGDDGCGAKHPAVTRHKWTVRQLRSRMLPLPAILDALPKLTGHDPDPSTVRTWRQLGKLAPIACSVRTGRELYLGDDVVKLATRASIDWTRQPPADAFDALIGFVRAERDVRYPWAFIPSGYGLGYTVANVPEDYGRWRGQVRRAAAAAGVRVAVTRTRRGDAVQVGYLGVDLVRHSRRRRARRAVAA